MHGSLSGQSQEAAVEPARSGRFFWLLILAASSLALLCLLSYDDRDTALLAGGAGETGVVYNWLGFAGARVSRCLLLLAGFGAFTGCGLLMLMSLRRVLGDGRLRPAAGLYWGALLFTALGTCMLFASWPDLAVVVGDLEDHFNIRMTYGGVIGQRLCGPDGGWLQAVLNANGNLVVAMALIAAGLGLILFHDWAGVFRLLDPRRWWRRPAAGTPGGPGPAEAEAAEIPGMRLVTGRPPAKPKPPARDKEPSEPLPVAEAARPAVKAPVAAKPASSTTGRPYVLPTLDLLNASNDRETAVEADEVETKKAALQRTLDSFDIDAKVGDATCGPRVTLFEVLTAPGVKVERISQLSNNIAMDLQATSLRILAPIPGKTAVGIEVPNAKAASVSLGGLMKSPAWKASSTLVPLLLGRNIRGDVVIPDLTKAPHLLIAGATGSGKSVCINALIMSMLYRFTPEELRLILIDPKVVEFRAYATLPHLVTPYITDTKKVPLVLRWALKEMERRYRVLAKVGVRNLEGFNARPPDEVPVLDDDEQVIPARLPFIVIVIDELADIMMTAKADVETGLARIAQLARAVGIHAIVATQRPSVNVITGVIKANFPCRIAFQVTSQIDSRTILDGKGAESLLGRGDMLFKPPGASKLERLQSAFVADEEIDRVVAHCAAQAPQQFDPDVFKIVIAGEGGTGGEGGEVSAEDEALVQQAIEIILRDRRPTTSYVQRCLRIGYNNAARIMEILEQRGVVGPQVGSAQREILIDAGDRAGADFDDGLPDEPDDGSDVLPSAADFAPDEDAAAPDAAPRKK
jgi:S-DNA-T family DNA segregation ATPase FtsK/SpoIIIE